MTLHSEIPKNPDGSPIGSVTVTLIDGHTTVATAVPIQQFAEFCGRGLEQVKQAEANQDPPA